jgi:hypothetical protein
MLLEKVPHSTCYALNRGDDDVLQDVTRAVLSLSLDINGVYTCFFLQRKAHYVQEKIKRNITRDKEGDSFCMNSTVQAVQK